MGGEHRFKGEWGTGEGELVEARPQEVEVGQGGGKRRNEGTDGGAEFGVSKQGEAEGRAQERTRSDRVAQEEKEVGERVETQQGKRQRERELERAGGRPGWGEGRGKRTGVPAGSYLLCHLSHGLDTGSI